MYVIVEIQGQQFKAEAGKRLYVHRLAAEQGAAVEFDKVLLVDNDGAVKVGAPTVEGAKVVCEAFSLISKANVSSSSRKKKKKDIVNATATAKALPKC